MQQIAQLLARLVTDRTAAQISAPEFAAAEQQLDDLYLANLGTNRALIHRFGTEDLLGVLRTSGSVHAERAYMLGALLSTEGAIVDAYRGEGDPEAYRLRSAALDILLEAGAARVGEPDLRGRIDDLIRHVPLDDWPGLRYGRLLRYLTADGALGDAETCLFSWLERAGSAHERLDVAQAADDFYAELAALKDDELEQGGFSRDEIAEGRADFAQRFAELAAGG